MSLINKMLKDLDKRKGTEDGTDHARAAVRTVTLGGQKKSRLWLWIGLLVLVSACAAAAWYYRGMLKSSAPAPKPVMAPAPQGSVPQPLVMATPPVATTVAKPVDNPAQAAGDSSVSAPRVATVVAGSGKPLVEPPKPAAVTEKPAPAPATTAEETVKPKKKRAQAVPSVDTAENSVLAEAAPKQATTRKRSKRRRAASGKATMAVEMTPQQQADREYGRAIAMIESGRHPEAMAMLEGVLAKQPKHAAARQTLAGLLIDAKRSSEAMRVLKDGIKEDAAQTGMAMILARLQVGQGDTRAAVGTLEHSQQYAKAKPDYQAFMAALYQRENRHKDAIEHYRIAVGEAPGNGVWWMGYGISLQAVGRNADARTAYTQARDSGKLTASLKAFVDQRLAQLPQ